MKKNEEEKRVSCEEGLKTKRGESGNPVWRKKSKCLLEVFNLTTGRIITWTVWQQESPMTQMPLCCCRNCYDTGWLVLRSTVRSKYRTYCTAQE